MIKGLTQTHAMEADVVVAPAEEVDVNLTAQVDMIRTVVMELEHGTAVMAVPVVVMVATDKAAVVMAETLTGHNPMDTEADKAMAVEGQVAVEDAPGSCNPPVSVMLFSGVMSSFYF